jgi:Flp pilus assembly protein CpaB
MAINLDTTHGISPQAQTSDRVDAYVQMNGVVGLLMQNLLILAAPSQVAAGTTAPTSENYILRVPVKQVPRFAYAAESGKIWFALRPQEQAKPPTSGFITASNFFKATP